MFSRLTVLAFLLVAPCALAANQMPTVGSYGFNWLNPDAKCKKMTAKDLAAFANKCKATTDEFAIHVKSHTCKLNENVEYMVYATAAQCQEALETTQANGD